MGHYYDCPKCGFEKCICTREKEREVLDTGAPIQDEVERVTGVVLEALGTCDLESALTVVCNIAGHLVAALSEGKPSGVQQHGDSVAENIKKAAIAKLLHDDKQRRAN